ncbi:MAG: MurR/RpiR family transcriptional regulator [Rhodospirillales bacterium]|nr:MurR/RpiR family transcriptional regulator [Rhodospirillales bacterium]
MTRHKDYDGLKLAIVVQHARLPKRLRQIAEFAIASPDEMALETVAEISRRAKVQPSSLVRFAKHFGFAGFSDMQRIFRLRLVDRTGSYSERIRETQSGRDGDGSPLAIMNQLIGAITASLQELRQDVRQADLEMAVNLLAQADTIGLVAQRRSFPIAAYLAYALSHLERRAVLIDGVGGLAAEQTRLVGSDGALIAVSFSPYAPETLAVVDQARAQEARIIAITDNALSPLVSRADVHFEIREAQVRGIRSVAAVNCVAVSLVVALGQRLEQSIGRGQAAASSRPRMARKRR